MEAAPTAAAPQAASVPKATPDANLAERLARIEATTRAQANDRAFDSLASHTTLKPAYRDIVRGLVEQHVGRDADLSDAKMQQKAAAFLDTLPAKLPDLFGPKAQRVETQSEWAAKLAQSREKGQVPKNSIAANMTPAQLERLLSGRRD